MRPTLPSAIERATILVKLANPESLDRSSASGKRQVHVKEESLWVKF